MGLEWRLWCHKRGDRFEYPKDVGKICPWLVSSIDPDGVTTEFVRCPDPTANLVAKIIRTRTA